MRAWSIVLASSAAAAVIYDVALANWLGIPLQEFLLSASLVIKMMYPALLVAGLAVVAAGAVQLAQGRKGGASRFLAVMSVVAPLLGALPCAYGLMVMKIIIDRTHTTNFRVYAPSIVEAVAPLAFGLIIGAVAALTAAGAKPRMRARLA